jgi:hypothetical protein
MQEKVRFLGLDVHAETIAVGVAEPDNKKGKNIRITDAQAARSRTLLPGLRRELPRLSSDCFGTGREHKLNLLRRLNSPRQQMDVPVLQASRNPQPRGPRAKAQILIRSTTRSLERAQKPRAFS